MPPRRPEKKINFKLKTVIDKEGQYIMIKGLNQEDITIVNMHTPNIRASKYIKQILPDLKGEIDNNTKMVGDFGTPLQAMNPPRH